MTKNNDPCKNRVAFWHLKLSAIVNFPLSRMFRSKLNHYCTWIDSKIVSIASEIISYTISNGLVEIGRPINRTYASACSGWFHEWNCSHGQYYIYTICDNKLFPYLFFVFSKRLNNFQTNRWKCSLSLRQDYLKFNYRLNSSFVYFQNNVFK